MSNTRNRRAASSLATGLIIGLISILAIGTVDRVGDGVTALFDGTVSALGPAVPAAPEPLSLSIASDPPTLIAGAAFNAAVTVGGGEGVELAASSSDPSVVAPASLSLTGTGSSRTLDLTTGTAPGTTEITLTATRGTESRSASMTITTRHGTNCLDRLQAGLTAGGTVTLDIDGAAGPNPAFQAECDQLTDGGGWTLFGQITAAPETVLPTEQPQPYLDLLTLDWGVSGSDNRLGRKPADTVARLELAGTDASGSAFALNMATDGPLGIFANSATEFGSQAAFTQLVFTAPMPSALVNASVTGPAVIRYQSTEQGYVTRGANEALINLIQPRRATGTEALDISVRLGNRVFEQLQCAGCPGEGEQEGLFWVPFQTGPDGFDCKNTMTLGRNANPNTSCTEVNGDPLPIATFMRLWYR